MPIGHGPPPGGRRGVTGDVWLMRHQMSDGIFIGMGKTPPLIPRYPPGRGLKSLEGMCPRPTAFLRFIANPLFCIVK